MRISDLIKGLQTQKKKRGDLEIYFSQDEEGNAYHDGYFIDFYCGRILALYPCGNRIEE